MNIDQLLTSRKIRVFFTVASILSAVNTFAANKWITAQSSRHEYNSKSSPMPENIVKPKNERSTPVEQKFYGIEVKADSKILFVIDCSASMLESSRKDKNKTRLDILNDELRNIISHLVSHPSNNGKFAIISFGRRVDRYPQSGMMGFRNRTVPRLSADGNTPMRKAWSSAIQLINAEKIDTVYFLTDGNPSDNFRLRWLNKNLDKSKHPQLKINCICLGKNRQLMKQIAQYYGGEYVNIP